MRRFMQANPSISVVCQPLLTEAECDRLIRSAPDESWEGATILTPAGTAADAAPIRRCRQSRSFDPELARRIETAVARLGADHFRFQLTGTSVLDATALVRYAAGDHFAWHIDNGAAGAPFATRKLSFVVQLTDPREYEGGDLEIAMYAQPYGEDAFAAHRSRMRERGVLTVFASFHLHRVRPIERGTRHALIGWLHGPPFH
jgi:predicted 2-oxoglutarate/Fe(II)-dependent dioxygenase YbiX